MGAAALNLALMPFSEMLAQNVLGNIPPALLHRARTHNLSEADCCTLTGIAHELIRNQHHLEARKLLQYVCASKYAKARDYVFLGRSYVDELGDTSSSNETARLLKKALQMEPSVQGYKERAKLFEMMGKPEMARKDLEAAKDLSGSPF